MEEYELNTTLDLGEFDYPSLEVVEPPIQIALVVLFSITATLSLGGNITVIIVLLLGKRSSGDLKAFLINLAVSDVTMAIFSIPFSYTMFLLGRWIFMPWFCPIVMTMQQVSVLASVYTLTAIGIDRYKAILYPLSRRAEKTRHKLIIAFIWLLSFVISSIQLRVSSAHTFKYDGQLHYACTEKWESETTGQYYTIFVFCVSFFIPLLGLGYTYSAIAWRMWKRSTPGNADPHRDRIQMKAKWKVIKMMVTIVVLFSVCWLPLQTFLMLFYFLPNFRYFHSERQRYFYALSYFACLWLANANSFVNPLVYSFMSDNFRADVRDVIHRLWGCTTWTRRQENSVRSISTKTTLCKDSVRSSKSHKGASFKGASTEQDNVVLEMKTKSTPTPHYL